MSGFPWFLHIDITKGCNFSCNFCLTSSGRPLKNELTCNEIISLLDSAYENGAIFLKILGGEPFFRKDILDIMKFAVDRGMYLSFSTNGSFFTKTNVLEISKFADSIQYLQVSIYGSNSEEYEKITGSKHHFNLVLEGLKNISEYDIPFHGLSVMTANNLDDMEHIQKLISHFNCVEFKITEKIDVGRGRHFSSSPHIGEKTTLLVMLKTLEKMQENWIDNNLVKPVMNAKPLYGHFLNKLIGIDYYYQPCVAGKNLIYVDSQGYCAPCPFLDENDKEKFQDLNIRKHSIIDIWHSEEFTKFNHLYDPNYNPKKMNVECKYFNECSPCVLTPCTCVQKIQIMRSVLG